MSSEKPKSRRKPRQSKKSKSEFGDSSQGITLTFLSIIKILGIPLRLFRRLDFLGIFSHRQRPLDNSGTRYLIPDTFPAKWRYIHPIQRLLYIAYILPLLFILFWLALALFIPWTLFQSCRPGKIDYQPKNANIKSHRDVCAPIGWGPHGMAKRRIAEGEKSSSTGISRWRGFWMRVWDMYCLLRECWHMLHRQGLQVVGVLCGGTLAIMQIVRMVMELTGGELGKFIEAKATGGGIEFLTSQPDCAYVPGTGFANWAPGWESFGWYILYHGWVLLLCLMLIADEALNVRMGLFAPQWSRGGTGFTIMFLALCLINSSPNWGWKPMIPAHHILLLIIFSCGAYNVLRLLLSALDCTPDRSIRLSNRRNNRHPLRPWTEPQWTSSVKGDNFRENQTQYEVSQDATAPASQGIKAEAKLDKLYPTEKVQTLVGDQCWELKDIPGKEGLRRDWEVGKEGEERYPDLAMKERKERDMKVRERGRFGRRWIHWFTVDPPEWTAEDYYLLARSNVSFYLTEKYKLDRFLVFIDRKASSMLVRIANRHRMIYSSQNDILEPTPSQDANPDKIDKKRFRWETEDEFDARKARNKKGAENYYGNHDWKLRGYYADRRSLKRWYRWFDVRRGICVFVGVWVVFVHVALLVSNLGTGTNNWPSYNAQYRGAAERWKVNNGPSPDDCQYYQGSALPIWIRPGEGSIKGVLSAMFFFAFWEFFIMHLCLGAILVSLTNNRTYGMHFTWPITLIGPRLSSVSIGWTLGFVGVSTLQMGLFHYQPGLQGFARGAGYACIGAWGLHLFRNETMRNIVTRNPWPPVLSLWAHEYMDNKKVYKRIADADED